MLIFITYPEICLEIQIYFGRLKHAVLSAGHRLNRRRFQDRHIKIAFLLRLLRNTNSWNKYSELHLFQFKWKRDHWIPE